uniref:Uncharacterized protein n=1 Tax=Sphaerodactylus townsendi TaxID=933632 RepID=A0ACB8EIV8_9SAUR
MACELDCAREAVGRGGRGGTGTPGGPDPVGAVYHQLNEFPSVTYASVGVGFAGCGGTECLLLYTEWRQPDLGNCRHLRFSRQHTVHLDGRTVISVTPISMPAEIRDQLLVQVSPTGNHKAVLTHQLERGQKQEVLEHQDLALVETSIYHINETLSDAENIKPATATGHSVCFSLEEKDCPIEALLIHFLIFLLPPGQFGCLAWSHSETQILYVAERKRAKVQPLFPQDRSSQGGEKPGETTKGEQFVYYDNWGEMLSDNSAPVLCVLNVETSEISVPGGIPGHISPGQAVSSPRLSPNGTHLLYLEGSVFGPHRQCLKLQMLNWQTKLTSTVVDVVRTATAGFGGIYSGALPLLCWATDNRRVLLSTPQRSRKELLVVDTKLGSVNCITAGTSEGSWTLLGIQQDLLVVSCSSPNCPPGLKVAVLPPVGSELDLQWMSVVETSVLPDVEWKILTVQPPVTEEGIRYTDLAFEALLLRPHGSQQEGKDFPLIVSPHMNYRGSLGFGQASIDSLISHVGVQDVEDTQLAVESALQSEPLDRRRIALLGGSHGGFICCHLIGRYPNMYKACAVRSPVINMATLLGTSDIPDWRYTSVGLPYCFERIPSGEDLVTMLLHSPIIHAAKVRTPLLLCVGGKDRRVSPYQAMEYYRVLQARGIPVRAVAKPPGDGGCTTHWAYRF